MASSTVTKIFKRLVFQGAGVFEISQEQIKSDIAFDCEENGSELRFKTKSSISFNGMQINGSSFTMSNCSGVVGIGTVCVGGNVFSSMADGGMQINGHRYRPYTVKKGKYSGKTLLFPDGFPGPDSHDTGNDEAEPEPVVETKTYSLEGKSLHLSDITVSGACSVKLRFDATRGGPLKVSLSGSSSLELPGGELDHIAVDASGASSLKGGCTARRAVLRSSGASSISGVCAKEELDASASGASGIKATAHRSCIVDKSTSGVSSINITRV